LELGTLLCNKGHVELLANNPTAAAVALTEAESIAVELNVLPASELAREISSLRTALSAGSS